MACSLGFYGDGLRFRLSLANHSDSESFLMVRACIAHPRWIPARRILGGGWTLGISS